MQNWDFADLWKTKMYKRKDIHNTYQCLRSWCIQQPVHVQAAYTRGSAGPRLRSPADTWAVMAVVKCGLFSARTLPWWRRTSWVWLTSKSLLINQHWKKISWFHTPVSQNLGHYQAPMQPKQNIRWMKWPANDSPLNTNSFWNWNVGILLIKIIIHQWSVLIKGLNWCQWGRRNRTQQGSSASPSSSCPAAAGAPEGGEAREMRAQDAISSEAASKCNCGWLPAFLQTGTISCERWDAGILTCLWNDFLGWAAEGRAPKCKAVWW